MKLPLLLTGPMIRRAEPSAVTVFIVTSTPDTVSFQSDTFGDVEQTGKVIALGEHCYCQYVFVTPLGNDTFPVDTHIHRLMYRWGLSNGKSVEQTERDGKRLFPKDRWNDLHLQIIYYGREHCTARGCDGRVCDICRSLYPNRKGPKKTKRA